MALKDVASESIGKATESVANAFGKADTEKTTRHKDDNELLQHIYDAQQKSREAEKEWYRKRMSDPDISSEESERCREMYEKTCEAASAEAEQAQERVAEARRDEQKTTRTKVLTGGTLCGIAAAVVGVGLYLKGQSSDSADVIETSVGPSMLPASCEDDADAYDEDENEDE